MTKKEIRTDVTSKRHQISQDDRSLWDQLIFERAHKHPTFQRTRQVHIYRSTADEVDTQALIEYAWATGKDVFVPRIDLLKNEMTSVRVTWQTRWASGAYGILEPVYEDNEISLADSELFSDTAVVFVPVVAFDRNCNRLGYGKGFYDRFLERFAGTSIGLAFEIQRVSNVPVDLHDKWLWCVATEQCWYKRQSEKG